MSDHVDGHPNEDRSAQPPTHPLVQFLVDMDGQFDMLDRRFDRLEDTLQQHIAQTERLAVSLSNAVEAMNRLCNHNAQDRLSGAMAIGLLQKALPGIDEASLRQAAETTLSRMRQRGWLSDLLDMEQAFKRQQQAAAQVAEARVEHSLTERG